jgi:hypothetical protein
MAERLSIFFHKEAESDKILVVRLERLLWARNKVGCSFFLSLSLLDFGFGLWRLHTMPG